MSIVDWFLLVLMVILALNVLVCGLLLLASYRRDPPGWWVRRQVPDFVPPDWGRPNGIGAGWQQITVRPDVYDQDREGL